MRVSRALLFSLFITLAMTLVLQFFIGATAFGLFLFLPLGFLWNNRPKRGSAPKSPPRHRDNRPIEPR